ncbi:HNH endonuclease signature motif containing protein [Jiangella muralis]|uniref:HNH endonuclease signature motif containing protein n=1 Tax=Jiangella muralis TaxID=702383 RepID=UPI00069CD033|nr:HNH endonuclease signature motif containing protein [Jiangella muralis]
MSDPIDRLAAAPPGAELASLLASVDVTRLPPHGLIAVALARQRQIAHEEAALLHVFAELADRPEYQRCGAPDDLGAGHAHRAVEAAGDEVSLALRWTPGRATARVALAVELLTDLPDTFAMLDTGHIDADKARLIADRTRCLPDPAARRRVEAAVLPDAQTRTRHALDQRLRREVITADPHGAEHRRRLAAEQRHISRPEPAAPGGEDGMATLTLHGPAEDLTALWTATDAAARHTRTGGDPRTLDQLRFDLLTGLAWTALESGHLGCCNPTCTRGPASTNDPGEPTAHHPAAHLLPTQLLAGPTGAARADSHCHPGRLRHTARPAHATADQPTPPGHRAPPDQPAPPNQPAPPDRPARPAGPAGPVVLGRRRGRAATVHVTVPIDTLTGASQAPGELDGYGPITAGTARSIASDATLRRLLTDPTDGRLLEYGRTTYAPPAGLAAHIVARDRTCRFPTCHRPATEAEIDHQQPYAHGGTTGPDNTWALHAGHHRAKTWHGFTTTTDPHGTTRWTTPAGHHYPVEPEPIGPIRARPERSHLAADNRGRELVPF